MHEEWRRVSINASRRSLVQENLETDFTAKIDVLFDIALCNTLDIMENEEDKAFLILQRKPE